MSKKTAESDNDENPIIIDGYKQDRGELPDAEKLKKKYSFWRRIPAWVKVLLINAWFGGAVFFFVAWGIFGLASTDQLDLIAILGLVYGLMGDIIINNVLITVLHEDESPKRRIMFHSKSVLSVLINCVYGLLLALLISFAYGGINLAARAFGWAAEGQIWLGADPFIAGIIYGLLNFLFVTVKNLILTAFKTKSVDKKSI